MNTHVEPLTLEAHKDLRVQPSFTFEHVKDEQFVPLNAQEFPYASTCYPIFIIKDKNTGRLFPVALFGLGKGENLFYSPKQWQASYVPHLMGLSPFSLAPVDIDGEAQKLVACVDSESSYVSTDKGQALFEDGSETDFLTKIKTNLAEAHDGRVASFHMIDRLVELQLLKAVKLRLVYENQEQSLLDGLYIIDSEKLESIPPDIVQEFHERGYFSAIYAMLNSRHNLYDLIRMRNAKGKDPIKSLQMQDAS